MRNNKVKMFLIILLIVPLMVYAKDTAYVDSFSVSTSNVPNTIRDLGLSNVYYYPQNATNYEFIDNNGNYNIVYTLKDNDNYLGWLTTDLQGNVISEKTIKRYLKLFGNALYYNNSLYVLYGQTDNITNNESNLKDYASSETIRLVKYNTNGEVDSYLALPGFETSTTMTSKYTTSLDDLGYGTRVPFDAGNAVLAGNNGIVAAVFAKEMYNGHQMSFSIYANADNLTYLNRPTNMTSTTNINRSFWTSHSFEQRIIPTNDKEFLIADKGDGFPRGMVISKTTNISSSSRDVKRFRTFTFREANNSEYGYNQTYATLGNLIEVSDGYILIGNSEKTLSLNYASSSTMNESRNIFIQKLDKNFSDKTVETIQKLKTANRESEEKRTDEKDKGEFQFSGKKIIDYGVKWLTNYTDKSVIEVRGVKLDSGNIAIFWTERDIRTNSTGGYTPIGNNRYFYEIINANGEVVQEALEIETSSLSLLINYNTKGNYIYWMQEDGDNFKLHRLDINKRSEKLILERVGEENIYITDSDVTSYKFTVNTNKDTPLKWTSSDKRVATVDQDGNVTILANGTTVIKARNELYNTEVTYNLDVHYKMKNITPEEAATFVTVGDTARVYFTITPSNVASRDIDWESSNSTIFTIEDTYYSSVSIKGIKKGDAYLIGKATDGSLVEVRIPVKVVEEATAINFQEAEYYIYKGDELQLQPILEPITADEPLSYSISSGTNLSLFDISETGLITNTNKTGWANVKVTGKYSRVYGTVKVYVVETTLDKESLHLKNGDSTRLNLTTYPYDYNPKWETSNDSVATVSYNGTVTAVGDGVAKITVKTSNGYSATCVVTVGDYLLGDMDTSGEVNMKDAFIGLKVASKQLAITDVYLQTGDINGNSKVEMNDVFYILKKASKQIS